MGDTLRYAEKMNLIKMEPRGDLSSTGYVLANPGQEYLILQPGETPDPFTVTVDPGTYAVEWFSVHSRQTEGASELRSGSSAPFAESGPVVLYLKRID